MESKVQIGGDTSPQVEKAAVEGARADKAVRELANVKNRIRNFYSEVSCVRFDDADGAPAWAEGWFQYLLNGVIAEREVDAPDEITSDELAEIDALAALGDGSGEAPNS